MIFYITAYIVVVILFFIAYKIFQKCAPFYEYTIEQHEYYRMLDMERWHYIHNKINNKELLTNKYNRII